MMSTMSRSTVFAAASIIAALSIHSAEAQYFGYFVEGGYRTVSIDRPSAGYMDHSLWKVPVALAGGTSRIGLMLDAGSGKNFSFYWTGSVNYSRLSGTFNFVSGVQQDEGTRSLDLIHLDGSPGLKVRVVRGLVIRLGATLSVPVFHWQHTRWTRVLTDDTGINHEYQLDETTSSDGNLFLGRDLIFGAFGEIGYELKSGLGLHIRGTHSTISEYEVRISSQESDRLTDWSTYSMAVGLSVRLLRTTPASNWGGVVPLTRTELSQRGGKSR